MKEAKRVSLTKDIGVVNKRKQATSIEEGSKGKIDFQRKSERLLEKCKEVRLSERNESREGFKEKTRGHKGRRGKCMVFESEL